MECLWSPKFTVYWRDFLHFALRPAADEGLHLVFSQRIRAEAREFVQHTSVTDEMFVVYSNAIEPTPLIMASQPRLHPLIHCTIINYSCITWKTGLIPSVSCP
jgi:hypothetical protein